MQERLNQIKARLSSIPQEKLVEIQVLSSAAFRLLTSDINYLIGALEVQGYNFSSDQGGIRAVRSTNPAKPTTCVKDVFHIDDDRLNEKVFGSESEYWTNAKKFYDRVKNYDLTALSTKEYNWLTKLADTVGTRNV